MYPGHIRAICYAKSFEEAREQRQYIINALYIYKLRLMARNLQFAIVISSSRSSRRFAFSTTAITHDTATTALRSATQLSVRDMVREGNEHGSAG